MDVLKINDDDDDDDVVYTRLQLRVVAIILHSLH